MASNFDFTDKAQQSLADAIQLAKDYANSQVHPAHIAFALINEQQADGITTGTSNSASAPLFASIISRAGGDPVSLVLIFR